MGYNRREGEIDAVGEDGDREYARRNGVAAAAGEVDVAFPKWRFAFLKGFCLIQTVTYVGFAQFDHTRLNVLQSCGIDRGRTVGDAVCLKYVWNTSVSQLRRAHRITPKRARRCHDDGQTTPGQGLCGRWP